MKKVAFILMLSSLLQFYVKPAFACPCADPYATNDHVKLWTQTFGDSEKPPVLLIAGAGDQSLLWPDEFCQKLASQGYYVIRYDHRETGLSTQVDYTKTPYTVMDLTRDALAVLDHYNIERAHIVGFSMGGQIAQFIGAYFPERAKTITLMGTSTSFEEGFKAFAGIDDVEGLSQPKPHYVKWATRSVPTGQSDEEEVADFVHKWRLLNGDAAPYDEALYERIARESFKRSPNPNPYQNHGLAMKASFEDHQNAPRKISLPTRIIQGGQDPVFGTDHGEALNNAISSSKLTIIKGMGHNLNPVFFDQIIEILKTDFDHEE